METHCIKTPDQSARTIGRLTPTVRDPGREHKYVTLNPGAIIETA